MAGHYNSHQQGSNATTEVVAGTTDNAYTKVKGTNQVVYFRGLYLEADSADGTVDIQTKNKAGTYTTEFTFKVNSGSSDFLFRSRFKAKKRHEGSIKCRYYELCYNLYGVKYVT
jgi:hypothetical protein